MNQTGNILCPLCGDPVEKLVYRYHWGHEKRVFEKIREHNPGWVADDGACSRCVDYYQTEIVREQRILPEIGPFFPVKTTDDYIILPTGLRLDADARFTGKGVTICFIDSGFSPHPDLSCFRQRIKCCIDLSGDPVNENAVVSSAAWHGTMTTVVCAGDGYLSHGLYKGIATEAELVLVKIMNAEGHIPAANIERALEWVIEHHREYGIRIVNMSLGDDKARCFRDSRIDHLAEQLIDEDVLVVAAVGNDALGSIKAPASSPGVIAVGGVDDGNQLTQQPQAYHSTYGSTPDGFFKPELVAHAIWIAAPLLPGTREQKEAAALFELLNKADEDLAGALATYLPDTRLDLSVQQVTEPELIRKQLLARIASCKYISPHYMHVDGTSFAAPIVSAVAAQLLELHPELKPAQLRSLLFSSAKRLEGVPVERQGFGVVQPRKAILKALNRTVIMKPQTSPSINHQSGSIAFYVQNEQATQIALAGSFNHWAQDVLLLEPGRDGIWKIEIPMLACGKYQYKFLIDERTWVEDFENPLHEPDGFRGFNSILIVEPVNN